MDYLSRVQALPIGHRAKPKNIHKFFVRSSEPTGQCYALARVAFRWSLSLWRGQTIIEYVHKILTAGKKILKKDIKKHS